MGPEIFMRPGHLINRASRLLLRLADEHFQPLGLAIAQMPVLYALKEGKAMTQKDLATLAGIEQPTMAQLLARMQRDGLVRRTPNPEDARSELVRLTPLALKKLPAARDALAEGNVQALAGLSEREVRTLNRLLLHVIENLDPETAASIRAMR